jgi:excisionase family DNA binding protein
MRTTTPEPPDYLTVEEAARVLRIGRTAAYALARRWRDTDGREGLPVTEFGRLLRVPRAALEQLTGGSITAMPTVVEELSPMAREEPVASEPLHPQPRRATSPRHRRAPSTSTDQPTLPLD